MLPVQLSSLARSTNAMPRSIILLPAETAFTNDNEPFSSSVAKPYTHICNDPLLLLVLYLYLLHACIHSTLQILQMVEEKRWMNNPKPTEKLVWPYNERGLPSKNHNRGKNRREKDKMKTENDVIGLDDERGLQQVGGESWTSWWMAPLDIWTCLERQKTKKKNSHQLTYIMFRI